MTIDLKATYETVDALQHNRHYADIRSLMYYCANALANDGEDVPNVLSRNCRSCDNLGCGNICSTCMADLPIVGIKTQYMPKG